MALDVGTRLGPYEVVSAIGTGGMGEVYRARDPRLGRDVAIKVMPGAFAADPDRLRRFGQEARAIAALNYPHICQVYDVGPDYLVLEIGGALQQWQLVQYVASPDGTRFLMNNLAREVATSPITIIMTGDPSRDRNEHG